MFDISLILWISVILQIVAVILALRLIPITNHALAWIIISAAFFLMALRRTIGLLHAEGILANSWLHALTAESVALAISILIVAGVYLIRAVFVQQKNTGLDVRKLSLAVEQNPSGTLIMDNKGKIEYANPAFHELYATTPETIIGSLPEILDPQNTSRDQLDMLWDTIKAGGTWEGEHYHRNNGHSRWEKTRISAVFDNENNITHYIATLEDISRQKKQHEKLEYMALHDPLTGLPNRTQFNKLLLQEITKTRQTKGTLAVLLLDSNNFKEINDTLGHSSGDNILKEIGTRLKNCAGEQNLVARMSGDEFLMLLPDATHEDCLEMSRKIVTASKIPYVIGEHSFEIGVSIGIALYPDDGEDHETLLKQADIAMYAAKNSGKKFCRYSKDLSNNNPGVLELASQLRAAVGNGELHLVYQPKINFSTGEIHGVETLLRWQHPQRGLLKPAAFIPVAEKSSHIILLTKWVIHNSLKKLAAWHSAGYELNMSINLSARDLTNPDLPKMIHSEVEMLGIDPSRITLEITESIIMMYSQQTIDNLGKLTSTGIKLSIDDFGTGYSSLHHLKELPISELKIDKSFITNMTTNDNDAVIVRSTIDMAHNLGLTVVAEGIEQKDTFDILEILRCDYGQGYLLDRPLDEEELLDQLQSDDLKRASQ